METSMSSRFLILVIGAVAVAAGCMRAPEELTPAAARAKGDELLQEMSKNLGSLQTFAYTADEVREDIQGGNKVERRASRRVVMRRPSALTFTSKGDALDLVAWYDGKQVTLVSNTDKVWARGPMPPTLDQALDFLSAEYAIQMPTADLLYSSPYDAVMTPDTTGGWVDVQTIGSGQCDHLAYQQSVVDWEIWLGQERRLPCRVKIVYKNEPAKPSVTVTYTALDLSPQVNDDTFTAKIPDGYNRIKIMRHATIGDPKVEAAEADLPKAEPATRKSPQ
jgi:hypothetical protein